MKKIAELKHGSMVTSTTISEEGNLVVSAGIDNKAVLWDLNYKLKLKT